MLGIALEPLYQIVKTRILPNLMSIKNKTAHPLHNIVVTQRSAISARILH